MDPVWKTPKKWKNLRLARDLKQRVLRACGGSSLFLEASGGFFAAEPLEVLTFKKSYPQMLLDQHLRYGWELLQYNLSDSNENWFLDKICTKTTTAPSFCRLLWSDFVPRTSFSSCLSGGTLRTTGLFWSCSEKTSRRTSV